MKSAFGVQHGSSGDSHAIVAQLQMIVTKMNGSNGFDSTKRIAQRRGQVAGLRQQRDEPVYKRPLGPRTSSAGVKR